MEKKKRRNKNVEYRKKKEEEVICRRKGQRKRKEKKVDDVLLLFLCFFYFFPALDVSLFRLMRCFFCSLFFFFRSCDAFLLLINRAEVRKIQKKKKNANSASSTTFSFVWSCISYVWMYVCSTLSEPQGIGRRRACDVVMRINPKRRRDETDYEARTCRGKPYRNIERQGSWFISTMRETMKKTARNSHTQAHIHAAHAACGVH